MTFPRKCRYHPQMAEFGGNHQIGTPTHLESTNLALLFLVQITVPRTGCQTVPKRTPWKKDYECPIGFAILEINSAAAGAVHLQSGAKSEKCPQRKDYLVPVGDQLGTIWVHFSDFAPDCKWTAPAAAELISKIAKLIGHS